MTPEQQALADDLVRSHIELGLSTKPIDKEVATQAVLSIYSMLELPPPLILFVASPFAASIAWGLLYYAIPSTDTATFLEHLDREEARFLSRANPCLPNREDVLIRSVAAQIRRHIPTLHQSLWFSVPMTELELLWNKPEFNTNSSLVTWDKHASAPVQEPIANALGPMNERITWDVNDSYGHVGGSWRGVLHSEFSRSNATLQCVAAALWSCRNEVNAARPVNPDLLDAVKRLAYESDGIQWDSAKVVISDRPSEIHLDEQYRLHRLDGPALRYRDGWAIHAVNGHTPSPDRNFADITVERIDHEMNIEVRRSLIERYGTARYMLNSGAKLIHRDATGLLYRNDNKWDDEPIIMVRVLNSTPEPDGPHSRDEAIAIFGEAAQAALHAPVNARFKEYMIRVPPSMTKAHEAVAWTFGLTGEDYHPALET